MAEEELSDPGGAIQEAIDSSHFVTQEERQEIDDAERERREHEAFLKSLRDQAEADRRSWALFERRHGEIPEPEPDNVTPCELRNRKCREDAERYRRDRDAWVDRFMGGWKVKRKRKRKKAEEEADPERSILSISERKEP